MPYIEDLNSKIAEATTENQERLILVEKISKTIVEEEKSLRAVQEEFLAVQQQIEGLIIARNLYIVESKKLLEEVKKPSKINDN